MKALTKAQRATLKRQYLRFIESDPITSGKLPAESYRVFRKTRVFVGDDYAGLRLPWIYIGIERDGHAHS